MSQVQRRYIHIDEESRDLSLREDSMPVPGAEEVLIEVTASGLNRADLLQRKGLYPPPPDASPIMGLEVSGHVIGCGEAVTRFKEGDAVCALTHGGGYASHAVAAQGQCLAKPESCSLTEAAGLPEALLTVWHNVFQRARLQRGERILMHGGASGIGTLGVAMCKALDAEVFSTAGTDAKCARVEELGAIRCFNYREQNFVDELEALGLKGKIDVVFDMVGGDFIQGNLDVAAPDGRIVNIAYLRGFSAEVNFLPVLMKRLTLSGSTLRMQTSAQKDQMVVEIEAQLAEHLHSGTVKPVIDRIFPLEDAAEAQAYMESGTHFGKILLQS
ncbi:MAG: NAD(P)H-quinone oxidoreductase [Congregibacter sp.]